MEKYFIFLMGFTSGLLITYLLCYFPMKNMKIQVTKLRGQVYYWSRQMPIGKKKPAK